MEAICKCGPSDGLESPSPVAAKLAPQIVDRAVDGLCWISLFVAVTSVMLTVVDHFLQPEFAAAWKHPVLRLLSLGVPLLAVGFMVVQRNGWLRKERLLDLGVVFQVAVAFAAGIFETAAYRDPNLVVMGHSGVAVWMMLCGLLMPNAPLRAAISAVLCVLAWPAAYWVNLQIFGYEPMPLNRLLVWVLPLAVVAVWMCILNYKVISMYVSQQRAENVGSYFLASRMAQGGMGEVWRAKHKALARDAAIKLIRPEVLLAATGRNGDLVRRRFEREAQVTASLRSPNTVELYDFGRTQDGAFYYAMELLDGINLQDLVERFGPLEPGRVIYILRQVCESLEEAHRKGLVHRDIKPKNIQLCKLGLQHDFVKVLDFGLVKALDPELPDRSLMTVDGVTTGTPAYLSPEVALGERTIDGRADLYSLGCVAYFLLTGRMVFEEPSPTAYALAHVQTKPPKMSQRTELPIPAALETIIMQLLEKEPANRIHSAQELSRRLKKVHEVPAWDSERAARWWETNLPAASVQSSADVLTQPPTEEANSPVLRQTA